MGENRVLDQALYSVTGIAKELEIKNEQLQQELDKYKAKEKELREYINKNIFRDNRYYDLEVHTQDILDILDRKE
jgi:hypothetical protein